MRWRADRSCWKPAHPKPICRIGWSRLIWPAPLIARHKNRRRRPILSAPLEIGSMTIHRIVEQEGTFFAVMQFFPTLARELFEQNRAWLQPRFIDAEERLMLCIQSYIVKTPHHTI